MFSFTSLWNGKMRATNTKYTKVKGSIISLVSFFPSISLEKIDIALKLLIKPTETLSKWLLHFW